MTKELENVIDVRNLNLLALWNDYEVSRRADVEWYENYGVFNSLVTKEFNEVINEHIEDIQEAIEDSEESEIVDPYTEVEETLDETYKDNLSTLTGNQVKMYGLLQCSLLVNFISLVGILIIGFSS